MAIPLPVVKEPGDITVVAAGADLAIPQLAYCPSWGFPDNRHQGSCTSRHGFDTRPCGFPDIELISFHVSRYVRAEVNGRS